MEAVGDKTNSLFSIKANEARFGFSIDGAEALRVVRFSGSEAVSELFSYSIQIAAEDDQLEFSDIVG
ncbi:MAG: phage late control D family protein, partial [Gammaproteobacteria bacterium]|nr:phage late control D family protein [Gammaproteobacteria bacterium]